MVNLNLCGVDLSIGPSDLLARPVSRFHTVNLCNTLLVKMMAESMCASGILMSGDKSNLKF